jgi:hypothetical protein
MAKITEQEQASLYQNRRIGLLGLQRSVRSTISSTLFIADPQSQDNVVLVL